MMIRAANLLAEARRVSFFALGELHGENEIPDLLRALWPSLWNNGYHHVAAELSPWAAGGWSSNVPNCRRKATVCGAVPKRRL